MKRTKEQIYQDRQIELQRKIERISAIIGKKGMEPFIQDLVEPFSKYFSTVGDLEITESVAEIRGILQQIYNAGYHDGASNPYC